MTIYLDENKSKNLLVPFTHTRHVADIRVGILTIREKWEKITGLAVSTRVSEAGKDGLIINANIIPSLENVELIIKAAREKTSLIETEDIKMLNYPWEIFEHNGWALRKDFQLLTNGRLSGKLSDTNRCLGSDQIFLEEGAKIEHCYLNTGSGPIYIGRNAEIMEGTMIRGPFCAGENSVVKMGAKIYGATTLGPSCIAGGEIKNAVFFGYSNKGHDGYLGDSVIGEWCNLGAGTSNSNVKNTGGPVRYYLDANMQPLQAGNKAGLLMGDYSRSAINTSFNTGTVVGVCCNIFGTPPANYVNNFSWGNERYIFEKVLTDIRNWKKMKGHVLAESEISLLEELYSSNL